MPRADPPSPSSGDAAALMSLYRQTGRFGTRAVVVAAGVAAVVALVGGYALGRSTAPDPTLPDELTNLRDDLAPAEQGIELTPTEYSQAVRGGKVVAKTEYEAAQSDIQRASEAISDSRSDLQALSRHRAAVLDRAVAGLEAAVEGLEPPARVEALSKAANAALADALGDTGG